MLLTLKPPVQNGVKGPHEYSIVRQSIPTPRSSPPSIPDPPSTTAPSRPPTDCAMDSSRRGLPPPSSMTLPPPDVSLPAMAHGSQLPPPPPQGQNADDPMRHYWQARAEEDRRKQEEEKTRQESLRLEQRKIEQSMLRDSFQAGVPPHLVPLIFAGISGGSLPQSTLELTQQYINGRGPAQPMPPPQSLSQTADTDLSSTFPPPPPSQRRSLPLAAEVRRDSRTIPPNPYAAQPVQQPGPGPSGSLSQPPKVASGSPTKQSFGRSPLPGPVDPRTSSLSRINTAEMQIHNSPVNTSAASYVPGPSVAPPQPSSVKQDTQPHQSSPSIHFHHWVPPGHSLPNAPSGKGQNESPLASHAQSHLRSDYQNSPGRKRKAQGAHQPAPPPSSQPSDVATRLSPTATSNRRAGQQDHVCQRSDVSRSHEFEPNRGPSPSSMADPNIGKDQHAEANRGASTSESAAYTRHPEPPHRPYTTYPHSHHDSAAPEGAPTARGGDSFGVSGFRGSTSSS